MAQAVPAFSPWNTAPPEYGVAPRYAPEPGYAAVPQTALAPQYAVPQGYVALPPTATVPEYVPAPTTPEPHGHVCPGGGGCAVCQGNEPWTNQWMPDGLIYHSYLAGAREPRFATVWTTEDDQGSLWEVTLGGRVGLFRRGTTQSFRPDGWQLDLEGACFPRLDPFGPSTPLHAVDFRFGFPITYGRGPWRVKLGYYHMSSHLGDEYLLANPGAQRSNYTRDGLVLGTAYYVTDAVRVYGETAWSGWADSAGGVAEPWEFQFGAEYSPVNFDAGAPFAAINARLLEESNFSGLMVVQTGWQFPQGPSGHRFRAGGEYSNGRSRQDSFFRESEQQLGLGFWYDF